MVNSNVNRIKSCTGCLYYSTRFEATSRKPVCYGITGSLSEVPEFGVEQANKRMEAYKKKKNFSDFRYASVGYTLYFDRNGDNSKGQDTQTEWPAYVLGFWIFAPYISADSASAPTTQIQNKKDDTALPQRQSPRPTNSNGDEFLSSFIRNANLVANGLVKSMRRIGNQVKRGIDDVMDPYRKRPK